MKKTIIPILIALAAIFTSCDPARLDIQNENGYSTGLFWQTEKDVEAGVISIYNMFYRQGTWTRNMYTQLNGLADDGVSYAGWTELNEWTKFITTNYNFWETNGKMWHEHWVAVFRCNQVLDNIDKVNFADAGHKEDLRAQAKFFRAFYYYYINALWDNVPIILHTSSAADKPATATSDAVMEQIETDLTEAIPYLPMERDADNTARPTKGAAYALLGKTYANHHKWTEAEKALKWLVEGEGAAKYDLVANWADNFSNKMENNKESIFEIHFSLVNRVGFDQTDNAFDPNAQLGTQIEINQSPAGIGWNNIEARRWVLNDLRKEKTVDGKNDIRLYYTYWYDNASTDFPGKDHKIYGNDWNADWANRVFIKKYSTDALPIYYWNDNNFRVIRYADILLLYAEVLNEVNPSPTPMAVECLNRVRNRVKLCNIQESSVYDGGAIVGDKDKFREHLQGERARELALECIRWIDLKRWGINDQNTLDELIARDEDFKNFKLNKSIRMPIPQSECDNNPNLKQNDNY